MGANRVQNVSKIRAHERTAISAVAAGDSRVWGLVICVPLYIARYGKTHLSLHQLASPL